MKRILFLTLFAVCGLAAQTVYNYPTRPNSIWQVLPQAVPTSATDVVKSDVYVDAIHLSNTSVGTLTCTVQDKQASPVAITPGAISIAANTIYILPFAPARWAPGGVTWSCSGAGVVGWITGSKRGTAVVISTSGD